jgi:hypothetical protein
MQHKLGIGWHTVKWEGGILRATGLFQLPVLVPYLIKKAFDVAEYLSLSCTMVIDSQLSLVRKSASD